MKNRIIAFALVLLLTLVCLTACSSETSNVEKNIETKIVQDLDLVSAPKEEYIISCLKKTPNIVNVAAVTVDNDPNGNLNKDGGYYSAVYFSVDLIDQDDVTGGKLIDKGTDAGGCIEAYKTEAEAKSRDEYLAGYDDSWLLNSGFHRVVGTLVIRTSKELNEDYQRQLENNIVSVLCGDEDVSAIDVSDKETEPGNEEKSTETKVQSKKIIMPKDTEDYIGSEWTIETITKHFEELGFTNIITTPCEPDEDNYKNNIFEMVIETGWVSTDPWKKGDEFDRDAEITIYYNESPLLTVDNCEDLKTVLTSKDMDYETFCEKYDGRYVEFDAYVVGHLTYDGDTSHIIDVAGGDYDGKTKIDAFDSSTYKGLIIRIGDRTWGNSIDENVEVGDNVLVSGKIDLSWAEYYKCLYVETLLLEGR